MSAVDSAASQKLTSQSSESLDLTALNREFQQDIKNDPSIRTIKPAPTFVSNAKDGKEVVIERAKRIIEKEGGDRAGISRKQEKEIAKQYANLYSDDSPKKQNPWWKLGKK